MNFDCGTTSFHSRSKRESGRQKLLARSQGTTRTRLLVLSTFFFFPLTSVPRAEELGKQSIQIAASANSQVNLTELEKRLRESVGFLCDDARQGRGVGSDGIVASANFIADSFVADGLRTDAFNGRPFQVFDVPVQPSIGPAENNRLIFERMSVIDNANPVPSSTPTPQVSAELDRTFRPLAIGDSVKASGQVAFVGFGITAPEYQYDDYAGIDARGKVVVVLRKEPTNNSYPRQFEGRKNSKHAYFETKVKNAAAHGAIAILFVNDSDSVKELLRDADSRIADETRRLNKVSEQLAALPDTAANSRIALRQRRDDSSNMLETLGRDRLVAEEGLMAIGEAGNRPLVKGFAVMTLSRTVATTLLQSSGAEPLDDTFEKINRTMRPASILLPQKATLEVQMTSSTTKSSNVIGILDGKGPLSQETIILGAHYDHVGMGGEGSLAPGTIAVHNGADDNASGTSALLASVPIIRDRLSGISSHRRVVFITFTAEERGLLGSEYYVRHPRFPLENTIAMVNLDMVGRLRDNDLTVYGTGTAIEMDQILEEANRYQRFKLFKVPSGFGPSDHQSFYTRSIPVLFFFTGLHNDYHRPTDDFEKINFTGLARVTDITSTVVTDLASRPNRLAHAPTDRDVSIRWQATAYLGVQFKETNDDQDGVVITGITKGGSADKAGLQVGDRIRQLDDLPVNKSSDILETMRLREPNDPIRIKYSREGEELSVVAILQSRSN